MLNSIMIFICIKFIYSLYVPPLLLIIVFILPFVLEYPFYLTEFFTILSFYLNFLIFKISFLLVIHGSHNVCFQVIVIFRYLVLIFMAFIIFIFIYRISFLSFYPLVVIIGQIIITILLPTYKIILLFIYSFKKYQYNYQHHLILLDLIFAKKI